MLFLAFTIAALSPAPTSALSPPIASTRQLDPLSLVAAERLVVEMGFEKTLANMIDGMIAGQRDQFAKQLTSRTGTPLPPDLSERIYAVLEQHLRAMFRIEGPNLRKAMVLLYASKFTASELDRLTEIQRDPVIKKSTILAPQIMSETLTLSRGMFEKAQPALKDDVVKAMTDYYADQKQ